jgi:SAM-dependent methyltransferase
VPWDGHPLAKGLTDLIEGGTVARGRALDIGCGTGDSSIYLARNGWRVVGVDFIDKPLQAARKKAVGFAGLSVEFVKADVTQLRSAPIEPGFNLVVDNGCLHGMDGHDRDAYVDEITAIAAPDARLLIVAFLPGGSMAVRGIEPREVERRFAAGWELLSQGDESSPADDGKARARYYLLRRTDGQLTARRREMVGRTTAFTNEFPSASGRMVERVLDSTRFWPEPIRRILWGSRPQD